MAKATFGAGCFWGVEASFRQIDGVTDTRVGYSGGTTVSPTYEGVCTGTTGHAEVVEVTFDPARLSYDQLLDAFWKMHDPTTRDRQGPDVGSQYRSVIFYHDDEQRLSSEASKQKQNESKLYRGPIVTLVEPAGPFYEAEDYHQRYLEKRGMVSCKV
ncbi:MAG TPA: peptide-methionine (S)-S-oxide reductase MsrA [Gemmatimonadaceae bacterium]|nr:peptide-methionine (S)-S-oxide reductase MsrA [Gemmatimonadaceae bacterium]